MKIYLYPELYHLSIHTSSKDTLCLRFTCNNLPSDPDGNTRMIQEICEFKKEELHTIGSLDHLLKMYVVKELKRVADILQAVNKNHNEISSRLLYTSIHIECVERIYRSKYFSKKSESWLDDNYSPENITMEDYWTHIKDTYERESLFLQESLQNKI